MALQEVERIVSEVNGLNEKDRVILFKKIEKLYSVSSKPTDGDPIQSTFGLWKDYDIDKTKLREKAWRKN